MRVLVVGINYSPDFMGVARYNTELCEALSLYGHDVRMITAPPYYPEWKIPEAYRTFFLRFEERNGVSIVRAPIYVPSMPSGAKRLIHHASFAASSALCTCWIALKWRPELIISVAPSLMSAPIASCVSRLIGAASWLHIQDLEIDAAFDLGLLRSKYLRKLMLAIERRIVRSFDRVSTISPSMRRRLSTKGVDELKLREIRNWIDLSGLSFQEGSADPRFEFDFQSSDLIGLYSGTMSNKQGLEAIVQAACELEYSQPNVKFVLCGEGPHKERLQTLAAGLKNIKFINFQPPERFSQLLLAADFHIIPQKAEAADLVLPSKLGGIFASGRPVIVMADPETGLAQEVEGAGLVIRPGVARELSNAVVQLATNPDLRSVLGENGRTRATERWDKKAIISLLNAEIDELINSGSKFEKSVSGSRSAS